MIYPVREFINNFVSHRLHVWSIVPLFALGFATRSQDMIPVVLVVPVDHPRDVYSRNPVVPYIVFPKLLNTVFVP